LSFHFSATVATPGTCGELVQGLLHGSHFLVSCPIDIYSWVTVEISDSFSGLAAPLDSPKAKRALELAMKHFGVSNAGACLTIDSALPRSKGMASSTADISGVIYATAQALGREISEKEVADLCLAIEPTDSSVFSGLALLDHCTGSRFEPLGPPPDMHVVVLDFGGEVDTLEFNEVDRAEEYQELAGEFETALGLLREGLREGSAEKLGRAATISALAHQRILPKPELAKVIDLANEFGASGVNVAHSGTVIGILFDPSQGLLLSCLETAILKALPTLESLSFRRMIGGGYYEAGEAYNSDRARSANSGNSETRERVTTKALHP
jgi:L-threonine kinase